MFQKLFFSDACDFSVYTFLHFYCMDVRSGTGIQTNKVLVTTVI